MPDIKRPNYFTSQFLVEKDFNDEQSYHLNTRRRHNRVLHAFGVAEGLDVTRFSNTQVQVAPGTAVDSSGREIMLEDARTYTLATTGNDLDVFLTIGYQEALDPADHDTQAGLDKFTRTTERPVLQDGTAVPPADGSVIVLARIHLSVTGAITSGSSIDTSVRSLAGAKIAPKTINTTQLADGSVTLLKLANEALPLAVQGINAISVNTDTVLKKITIGENHSARVDNPHATTAAQIDTQGGANRIVTQINAGTGIIARTRLESTVVSGVVTFQNLAGGVEMFSNDIDPGFGAGALCVDLALDDSPSVNLTSSGDTNYARTVLFRSEINRTTGRFRIFITRTGTAPAATATVRWYAFKPLAGVDTTVGIGVVVTPNNVTLVNNNTQVFSAGVTNSSNTGVTWSIQDANFVPTTSGGTLSSTTAATPTYTPPGISGTYHVVATSTADGARTGNATVIVNADITVSLNQLTATVFRGATLTLNATVVNTPTTTVTWQASGGTLGTTGNTTVFTAPAAPGSYTVTATSTVDGNKKATCTITVPAVTIALTTPTTVTVFRGATFVVGATVGNATVTSINWSTAGGGSISAATGPSTTFTAPFTPGSYTVTAASASDPQKTAICTINVPPVTISITPDSSTVTAGGQTTIRATITGTSDNRATWTAVSTAASVNPAVGSTTTWQAPGLGGDFTVSAIPIADGSVLPAQTSIHVPNVKNPSSEGGGKFAPILEKIATPGGPSAALAPEQDEKTDTEAKAQPFVRRKKRSDPKLPPEPSDG